MIKIEGIRGEPLHPNQLPEFVIRSGPPHTGESTSGSVNLIHSHILYGEEAFVKFCLDSYGPNAVVQVVEVTTLGSDHDVYLLVSVKEGEPGEPGEDDQYAAFSRRLDDLEERVRGLVARVRLLEFMIDYRREVME
jgi:hypothetical protein